VVGEEGCGAVMSRGRPLVGGSSMFKGGNEMRHTWSVRPGYPVEQQIVRTCNRQRSGGFPGAVLFDLHRGEGHGLIDPALRRRCRAQFIAIRGR
jgi:hypothetical protein